MKVSLFVPCFVNQLYPHAAMAAAQVIEGLGHAVAVPEGQTCCGQPAFNSGYWDEARPVGLQMLKAFRDADVVVGIGGSCSAMAKKFMPELFHGTPHEAEAVALSEKTWEFSEFLVRKLGVDDVGARFEGKVTFHDGCHGLRELDLKAPPRVLLGKVRGLELVEMKEAETCCGFGGAFAVKFAAISTAMAEVKCESILELKAEGIRGVVSNDLSCLMQITGWLEKQGKPVRGMHLAEVLASR
ncbi:L-lactate dehydrogenase complex protein LldE [Verrucomicrobium sp. GAS474]|uniref:(Fe-S)-binding protein n=1 Tax=Verrucomicrobium sp. GAS474 TaxID=1882831 RepID=UPI00087BE305|nr:(Fe-S)-binding protein [Verrucomicrobium sp. GAS474]SDT85966.1 L-lactate dehydrogenase complex protein LldE [Verrucomicrobium sp. GAS474]